MAERVRINERPMTAKERGHANLVKPKKGERFGGREKGQANKTTRILKDCILMAGEASGSDGKGKDGLVGYLTWLSRREPAVYGRLLERILPLQLTGKDGGPMQFEYRNKSDLVARFKERGLPVPPSLIEHDPDERPMKEINPSQKAAA